MRSLILTLSVLVSACEGFEPAPPPTSPTNPAASTVPTSVILTASSRPDQQLDISAAVVSANGTGVPQIPVAFSIGAGSITPTATTDATGTAHALAQSTAFTTITATIRGGIAAAVNVLSSVP